MNTNPRINPADFAKYNGKKYAKTTIDTIKATKSLLGLFHNLDDQDFLNVINSQVDRLLKDVDGLKEIHQDSEKIVSIVADFIISIFDTFSIKKFYNINPSISYSDYANKHIGEQILNNIFDGKLVKIGPNLIEKDYIQGGNCHHRSILVKNIFDKIVLDGVICEIWRFPQGHSLVTLMYNGKYRFLDAVEGEVFTLKDLSAGGFKKFEIANKVFYDEGSSIMDFSQLNDFVAHIDNDKPTGVKLQIDRIKAEVEGTLLKIEITKDKSKQIKYYEVKLNKSTGTYNKRDFMNKIFPRLQRALIIVGKKLPKGYLPKSEF